MSLRHTRALRIPGCHHKSAGGPPLRMRCDRDCRCIRGSTGTSPRRERSLAVQWICVCGTGAVARVRAACGPGTHSLRDHSLSGGKAGGRRLRRGGHRIVQLQGHRGG